MQYSVSMPSPDWSKAIRHYRNVLIVGTVVTVAQLLSLWFIPTLTQIADTGHGLGDILTFFVTRSLMVAFASHRYSHSHARLLGFVNVGLLFAAAAYALKEAIERFYQPVLFPALPVITIAGMGCFANWFMARELGVCEIPRGSSALSVNHRANVSHVQLDLWLSIAVVLSGVGFLLGVANVDVFAGGAAALYIGYEGMHHLRDLMSGGEHHHHHP